MRTVQLIDGKSIPVEVAYWHAIGLIGLAYGDLYLFEDWLSRREEVEAYFG